MYRTIYDQSEVPEPLKCGNSYHHEGNFRMSDNMQTIPRSEYNDAILT